MLTLSKRFCVLVVVACLASLQWHVSSESQPCPWHQKLNQRGPGRGPGNSAAQGCPGCLAVGWAMLAAPPALPSAGATAHLRAELPARVDDNQLETVSSPRSPPLA